MNIRSMKLFLFTEENNPGKRNSCKLIGLLPILFIIATTLGCVKNDQSTTYTIVVNKDNPYPAELEVNDVKYSFTDSVFSKAIVLKEFDVLTASLDYLSSQTDIMQLSLKRDQAVIATVSGTGYMWIVFSGGSLASTGGGIGSGPGSGSSWHYCGYPTQDGTPCQRHVSGTTGYCWQHR